MLKKKQKPDYGIQVWDLEGVWTDLVIMLLFWYYITILYNRNFVFCECISQTKSY